MRISANSNDPGYPAYEQYGQGRGLLQVYLDECLLDLTDVVTADEEHGYVEVVVRNDLGNLAADDDGEIVLSRRMGRVYILARPLLTRRSVQPSLPQGATLQ